MKRSTVAPNPDHIWDTEYIERSIREQDAMIERLQRRIETLEHSVNAIVYVIQAKVTNGRTQRTTKTKTRSRKDR